MSVISITTPAPKNNDVDLDEEMDNVHEAIVTPGELVTTDPVWMKGHGTYFLDDNTYSAVAGQVLRVNRLLSVIQLRGRYQAETGDHVVGRITEVGNKRWKVDIGCKQDAVLMLGLVNLPGGVLRRKLESDELQMRNFLKEGDLLNAEVQTVFNNGMASLHTRSLKYGKLRNGIFMRVPLSLILKLKNHAFDLPGNVLIILGSNGYLWLFKPTSIHRPQKHEVAEKILESAKLTFTTPLITRLEDESSWEIYSDVNDPIPAAVRQNITRYYNVIKALASCELGITEQRIILGYEALMGFEGIGLLNEKEAMESLCNEVLRSEKMRGQ